MIGAQPDDFRLNINILKSEEAVCRFKKGVLKNFVIFLGRHLSWSLFLIKLHA